MSRPVWPRYEGTKMHRASTARSTALALTLLATLGLGTASATPADGFSNTQDYAYASFGSQLDDCRHVDVWVAFVAGERLKNPINDGAPRPWSDVSVTAWFRDDCAGSVTQLTGFVVAPPDITRLVAASVGPFEVTITDGSGDLELEVTGGVDWTVAGPAVTIIENDPTARHFRADRRAPAVAVGGLVVSDADGDLWPGGFSLPQDTIVDGSIGWANEIILCCP
jgi:hypothetical protein